MKKLFTLLVLSIVVLSLSSCKHNIKRDAKRAAHKTEQCFMMIDVNQPDPDNKEFNECYDDLIDLMVVYDSIYKIEGKTEEFNNLYIEELKKTDLPQDTKDLIIELISLFKYNEVEYDMMEKYEIDSTNYTENDFWEDA